MSRRDAEAEARHLSHTLARLLAMREAAARLMARDQLGRDRFARGAPEPLKEGPRTDVARAHSLMALLRAYAAVANRKGR